MENEKFQKYLDYIANTGGKPKIVWFDDDWEPIGSMVRKDMKALGLIEDDGEYVWATDSTG